MDYYTSFSGEFTITSRLSEDHFAYLSAFTNTRRMARDEKIVKDLPDPLREAVGLPVGVDSAFYVGGLGDEIFSKDLDIGGVMDHNEPPGGQLTGFVVPTGECVTGYRFVRPFGPLCTEPPSGLGNGHRTGLDGDDNIPEGHHCDWGVWRHSHKDRQPGLWTAWMVGEDANTLWMGDDGPVKSYDYIEWLRYLIDKFFTPWGYSLSGDVDWSGEEDDDRGRIVMGSDNKVYVYDAETTYVRR